MTLFWLCLAWMGGIALAPYTAFPLETGVVAGILLFFLSATVRHRLRLLLLILAFVFLAGARVSAARPASGPAFIGSHLHQSVTLDLILEEDAEPRGNGIRFHARAMRLLSGEGDEIPYLEGMALVEFTSRPEEWSPQYGDQVRLTGLLQPPPEVDGFDYAAFLARQGVYAVMRDPRVESVTPGQGNPVADALASFRRRALGTVRALFPEPEGSLLAGILLGEDSGIPEEIKEAFSRTGTSHIVAISGFNISIIAGIFLSITRRMPRRMRGWLFAVVGIVIYTILVGASASVVRAAIMGILALLARQMGRQSHGLTSLAFSGAVMTLMNPDTLWDVGFQLSFAATLGLILFADPMQKGVERILAARLPSKKAGALASLTGEVFLLTFAAQITTLPLLLLYFQSLSLGALVINPLVLSVQPLVMVAGGLAVILGMIWLPAGQSIAWLGWAPTAYTIRVVQFGASFPAGWWPTGNVSPWLVAAYYALLFGWIGLMRSGRVTAWQIGRTLAGRAVAFAIPVLAAGVFIAWNAYFLQPDGRLHLVAANSGLGQMLMLRSPSGGAVLIDAGGDANAVLAALGGEMGIWRRRLDWVVVTPGGEKDAAAWLEIADRYEFGGLILPAGADRQKGFLAKIVSIAQARGIPVVPASPGYTLALGDDSKLLFLEEDGGSLVLSAEKGKSRWLIPVGVDGDFGGRLLAQGKVPGAQVLFPVRVAPDWDAERWLTRVAPWTAFSFDGAESGWPEDRPPLRVDAYGRIDLATDGEFFWVRAQ